MIAYVTIGTNDLARAGAFYDAVLGVMGATRIFTNDRIIDWSSGAGPFIAVCKPHDGQPASVGNGMMVSLDARDEAEVAAVHAAALAAGGVDEGAPGSRGSFHAGYFRDLDGNKLAVFHRPL